MVPNPSLQSQAHPYSPKPILMVPNQFLWSQNHPYDCLYNKIIKYDSVTHVQSMYMYMQLSKSHYLGKGRGAWLINGVDIKIARMSYCGKLEENDTCTHTYIYIYTCTCIYMCVYIHVYGGGGFGTLKHRLSRCMSVSSNLFIYTPCTLQSWRAEDPRTILGIVICLSISLSICLSIHLSIYLPVSSNLSI